MQPFTREEDAYGITDPISTAVATKEDQRLSDELEHTLRTFGVFESAEECQHRWVPM